MRGQLMAPARESSASDHVAPHVGGYVIATDGRRSLRRVTLWRRPPAGQGCAAEDGQTSKISEGPNPVRLEKMVVGKFQYTGPVLVQGVLPTVVAMPRPTVRRGLDRRLPRQSHEGRHRGHPHPGHARLPHPRGSCGHGRDVGIAKKAKNALKIKWSAGPMDQLSDTQIDDALNGIIDKVTCPATASTPPSGGRMSPTPRCRRTPRAGHGGQGRDLGQ